MRGNAQPDGRPVVDLIETLWTKVHVHHSEQMPALAPMSVAEHTDY